ncbi:DUF4760 domain-containing protein [Geodermatophilus obscurus]|uniref:DUF4760 domain-containing protein n=1 Tax=Geodermatophilus obscurus TaxID=1861 RepID=UPI003C7AA01A
MSFAALISSIFLGIRQQRMSRQAYHVSAFLQLMSEFRDPAFHDDYNYVVSRLAKEHSSELGVFDLPDPARTAVIKIAYFFQNAVTFVAFGLLDERKVIAFLHVRLYSVWEAIAEYVEVERKRNATVGRYWLSRLETYAAAARSITADEALKQGFVAVKARGPDSGGGDPVKERT